MILAAIKDWNIEIFHRTEFCKIKPCNKEGSILTLEVLPEIGLVWDIYPDEGSFKWLTSSSAIFFIESQEKFIRYVQNIDFIIENLTRNEDRKIEAINELTETIKAL